MNNFGKLFRCTCLWTQRVHRVQGTDIHNFGKHVSENLEFNHDLFNHNLFNHDLFNHPKC